MVLADWPGLRGLRPAPLTYQRAVWGKVRATRGDFGWVAQTAAFDPRGVEFGLALGFEDDVRGRAPFWCVQDGVSYAISVYPSRVVDHFGRTGPEKTYLAWAPDGLPPAAAAFVLLAEAARSDGSEWTNADAGPARRGPAVIDSARCASVDVCDVLPGLINAGVAALRSVVTAEALAAFYADIEGGRRPSLLVGVQEPLPATALAALLLPLEPEVASRLSLAGGIISRRVDPRMRDVWSAIVCDRVLPELQPTAGTPNVEAGRRAAGMLWAGPSAGHRVAVQPGATPPAVPSAAPPTERPAIEGPRRGPLDTAEGAALTAIVQFVNGKRAAVRPVLDASALRSPEATDVLRRLREEVQKTIDSPPSWMRHDAECVSARARHLGVKLAYLDSLLQRPRV